MPKNPDGGQPKPPESAAPADADRTAGDSPAASAPGSRPGHNISERKKQFLIAPRQHEGLQAMGVQTLPLSAIEQALRTNPDVEVLGTVGGKQAVGALGAGIGGAQGVLVARMSEQKATQLYQQGQGRVLVERDQHLTLLDPAFRVPPLVTGIMPASGPALQIDIVVLGRDGAPLADAEVTLFGNLLPATATTDANGHATLALYGETTHTLSGLYVKPKADYWSFYQRDPDISDSEPNVVGLRALSDWPPLAGFPQQKAYGWGQKAMRLDQLPTTFRGQGIRIAVIDSGAATTHRNLTRVSVGFDVINKNTTPETWNEDALGHGSHCTALIAGADIGSGLRGFAPDAELHVCKLFPGGQVSQLIDALEYCIEKQIDVVNLSLGGAEPSEALEQQIVRAKRAGIACIVAAGNSGGPVQYPASSPNVLAVAAIGKLDEFPPDSYHAETLTPSVDAGGYYPASFSCQGPQVAVCAPGVAIASAVPPDNFAAWDGTSMAAPHVTGLAALVLAHHPDFQTAFKARGPERVERLFQVIKMSARRVSLGDPSRTGYGLPDVLVAVGLQAPLAQVPQQGARTGAPGSLFGGAHAQQGGAIGALMGGAGLAEHAGLHGAAFEPFALGRMAGAPEPAWGAYAGYAPGGPFGQQSAALNPMPFGMGGAFGPTLW